MKVLGVDPGLRVSGYAVVELQGREYKALDAGVVRVDAKLSMPERLSEIYHNISAILIEHKVDVMAVEKLYAHYKHPRTAILMGHARGAMLLAAAQRGVQVEDFAATRIKKSLTGRGRASKEQMQRAVASQLGLTRVPEPADVADAMAVAMCCIYELTSKRVNE